jgi:chromosome segregation ATPase
VVELEQGLRVANQRCDELEELCTGLRDEVRQGREREVECSQRCAVLQVQWEEVKRQFEAGQSQRGELEAEVRSLHGLLLEKEGRAATAEERARQFEAQVEALRGEVAALTKERKRSN